MGGKQRKYFLLIIILTASALYQNCAPMQSNKEAFSSQGQVLESYASVQKILNQHCVSCHNEGDSTNSFVGLSSYEDIVLSGTIAPGDPDSSPLFVSIDSGSMPLNSSLSPEQIETIRTWILDGALQHEVGQFLVNSGKDLVLQLPTNSATLDGKITNNNTIIVRMLWRQISGPSVATITNTTSANAQVSNLNEGLYTVYVT